MNIEIFKGFRFQIARQLSAAGSLSFLEPLENGAGYVIL